MYFPSIRYFSSKGIAKMTVLNKMIYLVDNNDCKTIIISRQIMTVQNDKFQLLQ